MEKSVLINALAELAGLEEELDTARGDQNRYQRRLRQLGELQAELVEDAQAADADSRQTNVAARAGEGQVRNLELQLVRKRAQLGGLLDERQHRALLAEIAALERQLDVAETAALELLDDVEQRRRDAVEAHRDSERQDARRRAELASLATTAAQATAALAEITDQIEQLVNMLPPAIGRHVARLRSADDRAAVRVEKGACGGCYGQLPPQLGLDAEQGRDVVRCPFCARFVVRRRWR